MDKLGTLLGTPVEKQATSVGINCELRIANCVDAKRLAAGYCELRIVMTPFLPFILTNSSKGGRHGNPH
jgi:hypothetical protein